MAGHQSKLTTAACGILLAILAVGLTPARASDAVADVDLSKPTLPFFAFVQPPPDPSPWTGLSIGTEVFAVSGGKGVRGGVGGGGYVGYDREFANNWVIGVEGSAGYAPSFFSSSPFRGYNYAEASTRVGYDMGRLMPFVTIGGGIARPNGRTTTGYTDPANSMSDFFNSDGDLRGYGTAGAGFAYKLTPNTTVELAVQAYRSNGFVAP